MFTFRRRDRLHPLKLAAASVAFVGGVAACGGSSVGSSPAGVVTTLFSDIQANNCNGAYAQLSSRLQTNLEGKAGVCPLVSQLSRRYKNSKLHIDSVVTHGNLASVRATRTNPNGTSLVMRANTIVDHNAWRVDSLG
ncbi:MAG TPA: hypothetical protein VG476_10005 [Acidimicrobiales bacterium]|nr:hypothetical protein [Acidimicrobiales bacterium]